MEPNETISRLAELLAAKETNVVSYDVSSIAEREVGFGRVRDAKMKFTSKRAIGATVASDLYE